MTLFDAGPTAAASHAAEFEAWWSGYPRKRSKPQGYRAYLAARRLGRTSDELCRARDNLVRRIARDATAIEYVPYPATFLNNQLDDYTAIPTVNGHVKPDVQVGPPAVTRPAAEVVAADLAARAEAVPPPPGWREKASR